MQIAVCDDRKVYRDDIIDNCKRVFEDNNVVYQSFASGEELLNSDFKSDFLFLDIEMTGIDGIRVKELLERRKSKTKIIFLTSHEERMIEAFGVNVIGFIKKPLQQDAFLAVVKKMKRALNRKTIEWEDGGKYHIVYADTIRYIEAQDKYTYVVTEEGKYLVRRTVKEWEALLPGVDFCRVNRSWLVNLCMFDKVKNEIILEEGKSIRLSRKNKSEIMEQYKEYIRKRVEEA